MTAVRPLMADLRRAAARAVGDLRLLAVTALVTLAIGLQAAAQDEVPLFLPAPDAAAATAAPGNGSPSDSVSDRYGDLASPPEGDDPEEALSEAAAALVAMLASPLAESPPMAECAIDLLRTRLATAVSGADVLTAVALETELLALCKERQKLVADVLNTELQLAAMVAGVGQPGDARAEVESAGAVLLEQLAVHPVPVAPVETAEAERSEEETLAPNVGWFSILGMPGTLRAAVSDGTDVWWVREGSQLPDDFTVTEILSRPPGVTVTHPASGRHALPWRAGPVPGGS